MSEQFRTYFAEFVGTSILVFVGSLAILSSLRSDGDLIVIALGFGLALLIALYALGEVSGGHFNPAVTLAAFLDGRISLTDGVGYWVSQVAGGAVAALGIAWVTSRDTVGRTATVPGEGVGDGTTFLIEVVLTAFFVMLILKVTKSTEFGRGAFVAISLGLVAIHVAAVPLSGASVNPARSIGPALVGANADKLWLYLVAPLVGAIVGWVLYQVSSTGTVEMSMDTEQPTTS
jgi:aquaporin Z